jgi:HSP20 family protein
MTSLTRWNPFDEIAALWPRDLFGRIQPGGAVSVAWSPRCDVNETDDEIIVQAELPGVDTKDIEVTIQDSMLVVRGEKRSEKEEKTAGRHYQERFFGSFERSLSIPAEVEQDKIQAVMKDGVLEVHLPRTKKVAAEVKKIPIAAG